MLGTVVSFDDLRFEICRFNVLTLANREGQHTLQFEHKEKRRRCQRGPHVKFCCCTSLTHGGNVIGHFLL